jgi:hypothetical protein
VEQHSRAFVGIDMSKLRNAVAVAEDGRDGDVRYLGEIDTTEAATRKLVAKLAASRPPAHRAFSIPGCYAGQPSVVVVNEGAWLVRPSGCHGRALGTDPSGPRD